MEEVDKEYAMEEVFQIILQFTPPDFETTMYWQMEEVDEEDALEEIIVELENSNQVCMDKEDEEGAMEEVFQQIIIPFTLIKQHEVLV